MDSLPQFGPKMVIIFVIVSSKRPKFAQNPSRVDFRAQGPLAQLEVPQGPGVQQQAQVPEEKEGAGGPGADINIIF